MTRTELTKKYHKIDETIYNGMRWELLEHKTYGEDVPAIATDGNIYVETEESLFYTLENMNDEYEVECFA